MLNNTDSHTNESEPTCPSYSHYGDGLGNGYVSNAEFRNAQHLDPQLRLLDLSPLMSLLDPPVRERFGQKAIHTRSNVMSCIGANLLVAREDGVRCVAVPLQSEVYSGPTEYRGLGRQAVRDVLRLLESQNLIVKANGYRTGSHGFRTRIWATPRLQDAIDAAGRGVNNVHRTRPVCPIELRDIDRRPVGFGENRDTRAWARLVEGFNDVTASASIEFAHGTAADPSDVRRLAADRYTTRIFSRGSFRQGGRYYRGGWMNLSKHLRSAIQLDGEPTAELDYSGLHIRMCYAKLGKQLESDPYDFVHAELRPVIKMLLLVAINAESDGSAVGAATKHLESEMPEVDVLLRKHDTSVSDLYRRACRKHMEIRQFFGSDVGIRLQYEDSRLMTEVLTHFTRSEVPCLPVHDSAIVPESRADELEAVMLQAFKDRFGQTIPIKRCIATPAPAPAALSSRPRE